MDVDNQTEVFRVPQHNDVDAMEMMNDFREVGLVNFKKNYSTSLSQFLSISIFRSIHIAVLRYVSRTSQIAALRCVSRDNHITAFEYRAPIAGFGYFFLIMMLWESGGRAQRMTLTRNFGLI